VIHLADIVAALRSAGLLAEAPAVDAMVMSVAEDSRRVEPGALFCAIQGTAADGHGFVGDAAERGAIAALVAHPVDLALPQVVVRESRWAAGVAAREFYGRPSDGMTLIGVTGTNGKSTTVSLIRHLLNQDESAGSVGTLGAIDGRGDKLAGYGSLTTPGPVEFQSVLAALVGRGVTQVALEASSHGLDQERLRSVSFRAAVYTNLTHEHLDYHPDLQAYAAAKMKLSALVESDGIEVVNADDITWAALPQRSDVRRLRYGRGSDVIVRAVDERLSASGASCVFQFGAEEREVLLPLLGEYNVTNALAAAATVWGLGHDPNLIVDRLRDAPQVPGRMEQLAAGPFTVLRDYAHTPDGFERAIKTIKSITAGRLHVLFGCGGDRDRDKRPVMGRIAACLADLVILTDDNPRTEDPRRILDDIERGIGSAEHLTIPDRERAIHEVIGKLEPGDCLLLLGKGHETYQIYGTEKQPFDERAVVRAAVRELA
jgi:UDP-N-acetylmuramoyl-L-alanyl-D-glutamate--2,6-diaminopimelate ligase